jgi:hypothetical protein
MLTASEMWSTCQEVSGDDSATSLVLFKRWINQGVHIFQAKLGRAYTRTAQTASVVADQQYYQMPEDCIRPTGIAITIDDITYPLAEIENEMEWRQLNITIQTSTIPEFFFVRGRDEFGIWPIPADDITDGLEIWYEPREKDMSIADYTTGTVTVTNGDATITHSASGFTALMVGRAFKVTDGTEGFWYKIASYTDADNLELENVYEGTSGAAKTFQIGEMPTIPEEFHEAPIDYAMYRYYLRKRDNNSARDFKMIWEEELKEGQKQYSSKTTSKVIHKYPIHSNNSGFMQTPTNITM